MMGVNGQHILDLPIDLPMRDVIRLMTGTEQKAVPPRVLSMVNLLIGQAADHLALRVVYTVLNVRRSTGTDLELDSNVIFRGPIADFLKVADRVVVFVATIGNKLDELAHEKHTLGRLDESYILHAIGSAATDSAPDVLIDHLWEHEAKSCEALTTAFCPGYCGLAMSEQRTLFGLLDTESIGVRLLPSLMMYPLKSISGLVGIGSADKIERHGFPCERCDDTRCPTRPTRHRWGDY
jgi:hypothetical protein